MSEAGRETGMSRTNYYRTIYNVYGRHGTYKSNNQEVEIIGMRNALLFWGSNYGVDVNTNDAGKSGLHLSVFDTTTKADSAQIKLYNDSGGTRIVVAAAIKGMPVTRLSGEQGWVHDAFVNFDDIAANGENTFEFGNNFVVTKAQLESLADYYWKALGTPKHLYTVAIPGRCWWFEPGEWYTVQVGGVGEREYVDSLCECYSVQVESGSGDLGTTVISFREVEENWKKDSNALARFLATGDPRWMPNNFGRVVVAARDYMGVADYYCDGTADQVEIQAAINYVASMGGGLIELTEGQFNITAAIELNSDNLFLSGKGNKTIIEKYCDDYAIESIGGSGTEISGVSIENMKITQNVLDTNAPDLIYATYSDKILIRNVWMYKPYSYGITSICCDDFMMISNIVTEGQSSGIYLFGAAGSQSKIIGNTVSSGAGGIYCGHIEHSTIANNIINTHLGSGLTIDTCSYCSIGGNIVRDVTTNGIMVTSSDDNIISNNITIANDDHGIKIISGDRNVVTGNRSTGNNVNFADAGTDTTISGNDWVD